MKTYISNTTLLSLFYRLRLIFLFAFVILQCLSTPRVVGSVHHVGNETDHIALLQIKSQLIDRPNGVLSSWNRSIHHCYWEGVICGRKHKRVIVLDLGSRGLGGTLSPFIGNMSFLKVVGFYNNSLVGQIPPEVDRLFRLQKLRLLNNTLVGNIPANISACINLKDLAIGHNKLDGTLPLGFKALSKLQYLLVHRNRFTGPLFEVLQNLTSLNYIGAHDNAFTGRIPTSIGKLSNLIALELAGNKLFGTIPISIVNCSMLESLSLNYNKLHGEAPQQIGLKLQKLLILDLSFNHFSGTFPYSMLNLTNIGGLSLSSNDFAGTIPRNFDGFHNIVYFNLAFNFFEGDISNFIDGLRNCSKLQVLELGRNKFTGILPETIANLSNSLRVLMLGVNGIGGNIPVGMFNLLNLERLSLFRNEFIGSIPRNIGKLRNLEVISLGANKLKGDIPDTFGNLSYLSDVNLDNNQLQGGIPASFGSCRSLLYLDLSSNRITGALVNSLFKGSARFVSLSLDDNLLVGSIPLNISTQVDLVKLSLSLNKLSGTVPGSLGQCRGLVYLDIHGNFLTGTIPPSLSSLGSLQIVDLSQNNLSGAIPSYFSNFPLQLLNLSYNDFEGKVPTTGVFANISAIDLDGNIKLCGGIPSLHLVRCTLHTGRRKIRKLSLAFKLTISIVCTLVGVLIVATSLYLSCRKKRRVPISSNSTSEKFIKVSYNKLLKATNGFAAGNLVGTGNFGSVYRGNLDEKVVAIKVLNLETQGATKSFIAECNTLRNVRHRNLVGIITVCSSIDFQRNDFRALVFDFMPNGNLDRWLHGDGAEKLSLVQRVDIAIDLAQALNYLHNDCETPIVHCDLKPSNVLLDDDMVAHVGDFGLAKFLAQPRHPNQSSSIGILGTVGYVAPEYGLGNESSADGDIYSYGILVLELITGRRPTDETFHEGYSLQSYAEEALSGNVLQVVDPTIRVDDEIDEDVDDTRTIETIIQRRVECIVSMINIGIACSKHVPQDRMMISDVVNKLQVARDNFRNARHRRNFRKVMNDPPS